MPRLRIPTSRARCAHAAAHEPHATRPPNTPRQPTRAPATALVALLFGLAVPGAHAAYIGNAHIAAVGTAAHPGLAFAHAGPATQLGTHAPAPDARAASTGTRTAAGVGGVAVGAGAGQEDELAFNSTLTLAGIGLLCLIAHRRHASGRRT